MQCSPFKRADFIYEEHKQDWAKHMIELLLAIKKQVSWHRERNLEILPARIEAFERCYFEIIHQGLWHSDVFRGNPFVPELSAQ